MTYQPSQTEDATLKPVAIKERPILFSAPMVRAILAGTKTQTRRAVKGLALEWLGPDGFTPEFVALRENGLFPYGFAGDRLWVRESLYLHRHAGTRGGWLYAADDAQVTLPNDHPDVLAMISWAHHKEGASCPSIHMPRWASRIQLAVTAVRVERLQDISEDDAQAEGAEKAAETTADDERLKIESGYFPPCSYEHGYRQIWEAINGLGSWTLNPWVWVIEFQRAPPKA